MQSIEQLTQALEASQRQNEQLRQELAEREQQNQNLRRMLDKQRQMLEQYLKRLIRSKVDHTHPDQLLLDDLLLDVCKEAQTALDEEAAEADEQPQPPKAKAKRKRKYRNGHPGRLPLPEHLPRRVERIDVPDDEKHDPITGKELQLLRFERTEKLEVRPARLEVLVIERPVYALPGAKCMAIAEMPRFAIDKAIAGNGFLADVAVKRFIDHLPYYRQAQALQREKLSLHRNDLNGWMLKLGCEVLADLYRELERDVHAGDYIGFDDSGIKLQVKGNGRLHPARMWVMRKGTDPPQVYFKFTMSKEKHEATALLGEFRGYAQADAYAGHDEVMATDGIVEVGCWAHAIRRFKAAVDDHDADAEAVLDLIGQLYRIEDDADKRYLKAEQRQALRRTHSQAVLAELFGLFETLARKLLPKSKLAEAVGYCLNQREALCRYTEDGRLLIDNNEVERALRPLGIGRRNWLFAGSERGGQTAAVFMSLFGSCRALKINPWLYLKDVLDRIPTYPKDKLRELLPGYWQPLPANTQLGVPVRLD